MQGFVAGVNAALKCRGQAPFILRRSDGYIGTLIDDLVTKGTNEPYRIMTSRSEYRLLHRQDNADWRMRDFALRIGLMSRETYDAIGAKYDAVRREIRRLESTGVAESEDLNRLLAEKGTAAVKGSARLADLVRRPQLHYDDLAPFDPERPDLDAAIREQVEIQLKYAGYIARQLHDVEQFQREESRTLPTDIDYSALGAFAWKRGRSFRRFVRKAWAGQPHLRRQPCRRGSAADLARAEQTNLNHRPYHHSKGRDNRPCTLTRTPTTMTSASTPTASSC